MIDTILENFLTRQQELGMALAESSDILDLQPLDGPPARHYRARFRCRGMVRTRDGKVAVANHFEVGIRFLADYLRRANTFEVLTWISPREIFHPNIHDRAPYLCLGKLRAGTPLVDILYGIFEIVSYHKMTVSEEDALNHDACAWARRNQHLFPVDRRPLKRRTARPHSAPSER
ncbi:MAG: hypothetical protein V3U86_04330 [Acidobacteriota bacterium]|nr:hypothetical protein [Acidobacteriota bacterium]